MPVLTETPSASGPITDEEFAGRLDRLVGEDGLAIAVSGGPDSLALLHLADRWARQRGRPLHVYTVDHGFRPEATAEAEGVAAVCAALGRPHRTLTWLGDKPATGLQAAARTERYRLLAQACRADGVGDLLLAHHLDDQAETVLHRIDRGTGPDGLAGMAAVRALEGLRLLRPLLDVPKARLVATCRTAGLVWAEDPSNGDPRFARTGLRLLATALADAGITADRLGRLAAAMAVARTALDLFAAEWVAAHAAIGPAGTVGFDPDALAAAPDLLRRRLLDGALRAVGGASYPARGERLERLLGWIGAGASGVRTLGGCRIERAGRQLRIVRDWRQAGRPVTVPARGRVRWDGRFEIHNATSAPVRVGVCGEEGWRRWRRTAHHRSGTAGSGWPHAVRLALPAVVDLDGGFALPHLVSSTPAPSGWVGDAVRFRFRTTPLAPNASDAVATESCPGPHCRANGRQAT